MQVLFEPAPNQPSASVTMIGRLTGATVAFEPGMVLMELQGSKASQLTIGFAGASSAMPRGTLLQKSQSNYLLGHDPAQWRTHVPNYKQVIYGGLYPGINAVFYGNGQLLEHDFVIAPGSDYRQIRLHLSEHAHATIGSDGEMTIKLSGGNLQMHKPVIYQDAPGGRQLRKGSFDLLADGDIGFTVKSYDHRRPLVIDPVLSFSTYLAPIGNNNNYIAIDSGGNNYLAGYTTLGFPVTPGVFAGCGTCFTNETVTYVSKLSADGKTLVYSTLLGGNNNTETFGISVDADANALVSGRTEATDFPTKNGQAAGTGGAGVLYGFLTSLSPDGSSLNYSTLLGGMPPSGGTANTTVSAITVDAAGNAYVTGDTSSSLYPYTAGAVNNGVPTDGVSKVFLSEFSPAGALIYSAFLGDPAPQNTGGGPVGAYAVAVDNASNAFVAGQAGTLWPTTSGVYLQQIPGPQPYAAPFVTEVAAGGASILYSTYLNYANLVSGIVVAPDGNVFVAGTGAGPTYPTTPNAYQPSSTAATNSVLTELNATGAAVVYSTFFGDTTYYLNGLALDPDGDLWLAGQTQAPQFPLAVPLQDVLPLEAQSPLAASTLSQLDPTGTILKFSTFLGGIAYGQASGVAVDANHRAHIIGAAASGLYTTAGAYLEAVHLSPPSGHSNIFPYVALVDPTVAAPALCVTPNTGLNWGMVTAGTFLDLPLTITNCGTQPLAVSGASPAANVFTVPAAENGCAQTLPAGQSCKLSVRYSPSAPETDTSALTLQSNASITQTVLPLYGIGLVPSPPPAPVATLSPASLTFATQAVATASIAQSIALKNSGNADLSGMKITITGADAASFAQTNNCGATVSAGTACSINVVFAPASADALSATVNITNNAANSPQTIAVSGTGTQALFVISPPAGGSTTTKVTAGQPAAYPLLLTPAAGYSGTISLSCSGLPANAICSFTPATLALGGGKAETFTVTITTEVTQTSDLLGKVGAGLAGILLLLPLGWRKRRGAATRFVFSVLLLLTAGLSGCGGGSRPTPPTEATVTPGTYTIQVVASDGTTMQKMPLTLVVM